MYSSYKDSCHCWESSPQPFHPQSNTQHLDEDIINLTLIMLITNRISYWNVRAVSRPLGQQQKNSPKQFQNVLRFSTALGHLSFKQNVASRITCHCGPWEGVLSSRYTTHTWGVSTVCVCVIVVGRTHNPLSGSQSRRYITGPHCVTDTDSHQHVYNVCVCISHPRDSPQCESCGYLFKGHVTLITHTVMSLHTSTLQSNVICWHHM